MSKRIEMEGRVFGRLTVVDLAGLADVGGDRIWVCRCECGNTKPVRGNNLRSGTTKSCGCLQRAAVKKNNKKRALPPAPRVVLPAEGSRKVRRVMVRDALAALTDAGVQFEDRKHGLHLLVHAWGQVIDFWPSTGLWIVRDGQKRREGLHSLLKFCAEGV